jgi:two-component system, NtrC family, nitrogen regulation sensor histidine kinase NtrY
MNEHAINRPVLVRVGKRFLALVASFLLATLTGYFYSGNWEYRFLTNRVEKGIARKSEILKSQIANMKEGGIEVESLRSAAHTTKLADLRREGITLLVYCDSNLIFWSDNSFDVPSTPIVRNRDDKLLFIHNGYFLKEKVEYSDTVIIGLLRVYSSYDIENSFVRSGFPEFLRLPSKAELVITPEISDYHVNIEDGEYLFSILFPDEKENSMLILLPITFWALFLLFLILLTDALASLFISGRIPGIAVLFKGLMYPLLYYLLLQDMIPEVLQRTELFMRSNFSIGPLIPSIGHLFILSILLADLARTFYLHLPVRVLSSKNMSRLFLGLTLALVPGTILLILFHQVVVGMFSHPNIAFEGFKVAELSFLSVAGVTSLFLLILGPAFYFMKILSIFFNIRPAPFLIAVGINMLIFLDVSLFGISSGIPLAIFFLAIMVLLSLRLKGRIGIFNLAALFSVAFSVYGTWYISTLSIETEKENLRVMALSFASEHDPVAEYLILDLNEKIESDTTLMGMMKQEGFGREEVNEVSDYLRDQYFGDYWTNYEFSMVMCDEQSSLRVQSEDRLVSDCFGFFAERIDKEGENVTGTKFYFIDNRTGRPCYMGVFYFPQPGGGINALFIELFSYVNAFREGYPELLVDKKYMRSESPKGYSFAKYIDGNLVLNTGEFRYWTNDRDLEILPGEYIFFDRDEYRHILYNNGNITVILSRPEIKFISRIVSFAWLFIFILALSSLLAFLYRGVPGRLLTVLTFRQKMQAAFVLVVLFSFVGIAAGAAWLSGEQYRSKHYDNIREKASSVYIELEHKLSEEASLSEEWTDGKYNSLSELLVKFSNVFYADINLYDSTGMLLATSRPEIFIRDLTSQRMDKFAHLSLSDLAESEYIAWEKTGSLEYLSIYMPFYNNRNELLAYLNIPYFRMQSVLATEISNLIVAIINFSLLMILATMSIGVFISDRITSPIRMLGDVLASVKLGQRSQRLTYTANDEIGDLVKQYNRMVEELEESARKLTASEREYAWREMARQIAHEIKNPLTPMKLNVQQLEKNWKDNKTGFEKKLERFTRNQIEYIDTLSSIATAFSSFARLPKATPAQIDLLEQIKTSLELFKNSSDISFRINTPSTSTITVYADREHLNSIFSNLIKNGIQAIPPGTPGLIRIGLKVEGDRVIVSISDNGPGIPEEVRSRLFTPYFTTKSSGSGLGLSIVKRFVEGMGGEISFESDPEKGTTFTVTLPVLYTAERL